MPKTILVKIGSYQRGEQSCLFRKQASLTVTLYDSLIYSYSYEELTEMINKEGVFTQRFEGTAKLTKKQIRKLRKSNLAVIGIGGKVYQDEIWEQEPIEHRIG